MAQQNIDLAGYQGNLLQVPADVVSSVNWPLSKIVFGALDSAARFVSESDRLPVAPPVEGTTTRAYNYTAGVSLTAGSASSRTASGISATEICLHNSGPSRVFVRQGNATVNASVEATSLPLEPGEKLHLRHTSGQYVAAIRDGDEDSTLYILPVA